MGSAGDERAVVSVISANDRLEGFLAEYEPEVARQARTALEKMRRLYPGAVELVYDNYNALVIGFCPTERPSTGIFSIAVYPSHVTLCFLKGARLDDPAGLLRGSGNVVRHVRLDGPETLDRPEVIDLIDRALLSEGVVPEPSQAGKLIIQSVSPNRRPRRAAN